MGRLCCSSERCHGVWVRHQQHFLDTKHSKNIEEKEKREEKR
jgi:hypothetical protein